MATGRLAPAAQLKLDLMFEGVRYTEALGRATDHSYPNFYPYRFEPGEPDPTGKGRAEIPYLLRMPDTTTLRIKGNGRSDWAVDGSLERGYTLHNRTTGFATPIDFEPLPAWMTRTVDGLPMAQAGVSLHSDMAVVNIAPGCEYFLHKKDGKSMRCAFCAYGAPDERTHHLGQESGTVSLPAKTYERMRTALEGAMSDVEVRHIYLVGGSMPDWRDEGARFLEIAREAQKLVQRRVPVTLGSGALPQDILAQFREEGLVDAVCFNLEVWSEALFAQVCPGKNHFVGYGRWIESLEHAVRLWGRGRVYTAMVAGIELEPEYGMSWEEASDLVIRGAEDLCSRGIIPIYSLYWPVGGRDHPDYMGRLRSFFEKLNLAYSDIRRRHGLEIWEGFMCHRCAYMQLECDIERGMRAAGASA